MPKLRKPINKGLPTRWINQHGAYYFRVPKGLESKWDGKQLFRLGKSLPEAYRTWADRSEKIESANTIGDLLDRYLLEVVPKKAKTTQSGNQTAIKRLRSVFGEMPLLGLIPKTVYQYVDKRDAKIAAHREVEVLSHAFTKAVEWGYIDRHPFKGEVRLEGEPSRDRYVEDWEVIECLSLATRRKKGSVGAIQAYIRLKLMTGMARGDLLRLTVSNIKDDGIHIQRHKTAKSSGKRTVYQMTPELKTTIDLAIASRPAISPFLFCKRDGHGYIDEETGVPGGWKSMWQRFMARVMAETKVTVAFTEHDLRAKCASDAETLEHARALLNHADARTTNKIYRRKPEQVLPLRGVQ
jgi:integrase